MTRYEYKVISAPQKGIRQKGVKGAEGRFAYMLEKTMNDLAIEGWEFQRAETLPSEERSGLTSKSVIYRNVLVFRRAVVPSEQEPEPEPKLLDAPQTASDEPSETNDTTEDVGEDETRL